MPVTDKQQIEAPQDGSKRRRRRLRAGVGVGALALVAGSSTWLGRERIAGDLIDGYLDARGVTASYDIVAVGPRMQVIENLVIGDPARPDLTVRRMAVELGVGWAGPEVRRISVDGVRAFGSYTDGQLSFGALDPLVFTGSEEPPALPAVEVVVSDARALLESDYGAVGLALSGAGRLDDGFAGTLAALAPGVGTADCRAGKASLYGRITTASGAARLDGPLRLSDLTCGGAQLARADIGTAITLTRDFAGGRADLVIKGGRAAMAGVSADGLGGSARVTWSPDRLALSHDLAATRVASPQGTLARLTLEGAWRGVPQDARGAWEGRLRGTGLAPAPGLSASLAEAETALAGTLLAPLAAKGRAALGDALDGARIGAQMTIRHRPGAVALIIPQAGIDSGAGVPVVALSQINAALGAKGLTGLRGNILVGGEGLPNINGRMEQEQGSGWTLRLAMAEYVAGANRLAIPRLALTGSADGAVRFDGLVTASGDLPGGTVQDVALPLEGGWTKAGGLAVGTRCARLRFAGLSLSGLAMRGQQITLCPEGRGPMLAHDGALTLAARTGPLALTGQLGDGPASVNASRVVLRYPRPFAIENLALKIGAPGSEARLSAAVLSGGFSGGIGGTFAGGAAGLDAVPFDLDAMAGRWSFADGALRIAEGSFTVSDRPPAGLPRFAPLAAEGAALRLVDNTITAEAVLQHPASRRKVAEVDITHRFPDAGGSARLRVPGLLFDKQFQPEDLSDLAKGVIAFAEGGVTGTGLVEWSADAVTSGGTFGSEGLDFAAAFGPVRGLKGQVRFTDLLALTTAPDQTLTIAAINPGIEVLAGQVRFDIKDGTLLSLREARFPFMGGQLVMRPLVMDFSQPEARRYVFDITGLDAATFVAEMELTNLSATGTFDGTVPIVFDAAGNGRIEKGELLSRAGGGNVAYIGELTYEDLGAMGNYAFAALRSLDYRYMRVGLNGDLAGEIITNFDFDGVRQGEGTSQNFLTRRIARLPIRFKVNVRSENFYELATMVRSFWDADFLGNPVDRGLLTTEGGRFVPANRPRQPVQPPESESQP